MARLRLNAAADLTRVAWPQSMRARAEKTSDMAACVLLKRFTSSPFKGDMFRQFGRARVINPIIYPDLKPNFCSRALTTVNIVVACLPEHTRTLMSDRLNCRCYD